MRRPGGSRKAEHQGMREDLEVPAMAQDFAGRGGDIRSVTQDKLMNSVCDETA
jgi:hypothetical protein